ncbi:VWA domain-containing protein [Methanolobus psychrotolerans]|uniref:VWA domain-containing protein n=1 Tax=Methanolobus psychrotolerans TaxID=1874706 RepID=UPI000B916EB1|nr:VWA domain-containing protein [Methanolobus psychrotolerans]
MINKKLYKLLIVILLVAIVTISMGGTVNANSIVAPPTVTKTASPTNINIAGSGTNEYTTVAITVTGAGSSTTAAVPVDIVFAIDSSGSMAGTKIAAAKSAAKDFVGRLDAKDQAGVVSWASSVRSTTALTSDFSSVNTSIGTMYASGGTNLDRGLTGAINVLNANTRTGPSAEVILFLSDGDGTYTPSTAVNAAAAGYTIYSIGLGNPGAGAEGKLKDMANKTGGKYFSSPTSDNLDAIYQEIYSEVATSTIPHYVDVIEVTQDYIVEESSFSITPDSITTDASGNTVITWTNIGMGDSNPDMSNDETVVLSFEAKCSQSGSNLPVDVLGDAKVCYKDSEGNAAGCVDIPQAYINVGTTNEEIPEFPTIAIPMVAIIGLAFVFSRRE